MEHSARTSTAGGQLLAPTIFSEVAGAYARYRPRYPAALFASLALMAPRTSVAWDAATGSGQAAVGLAEHFDRVVATDASAEQIDHAAAHPRVDYRVATAEASGLASGSVDLVTAAQAAHWFDLPAFYSEARRVLRPDGVLAVWTYGLPRIDPTVDGILHRYVDEILAPYMAPELRYVMSGYRTLPFPTEGAETRGFRSETQGSLDDLVGFLSSFSGAVLFEKAEGRLPVDGIYSDLTVAWGAPDRVLRWRWDFSVRLARLGAKRLTLRTSL